MPDLSAAIENLPALGLIPAALLLVTGVILWAAGRRVLQPALAACGGLVGLGLGYVLGDAFGSIVGAPPWIVAVVLGLLAACMAAILSRAAVVTSLAAVFAFAAPVGVLTVHEIQTNRGAVLDDETPNDDGTAIVEDDGPDEASAWLFPRETESIEIEDAPEAGADDKAVADTLGLGEQGAEVIHDARAIAADVAAAIEAWWSEVPEKLRTVVLLSAGCGLLTGVLVGTLAKSFATVVVTAFGGALIWLLSLKTLVVGVLGSAAQLVPATATATLSVWLITAFVGIVIQWTLRPRRADDLG